ncbi:MAG: amidase family protein [Spirosomaceae bacterium]|nr:amidase family protein [Spirosomataceae bacterium]
MKKLSFLLLFIVVVSCKKQPTTTLPTWERYDQAQQLAESQKNESARMKYQLIQSRVRDRNEIWQAASTQLQDFDEEDYATFYPLIYNRDIPSIQKAISDRKLTYKQLTQWYMFRIVKFESDVDKFTNSIITINPNAVAEAIERDKNRNNENHPVFGMPIIIKDNIGLKGTATTAGAAAFLDNYADDAFIVSRIKEKGGIILAKSNLSEWANFLCGVCPNGYSAVGGQTLNAYGRKKIDTGGSSSGSGVSMAANYAAAAVGTETSGSILSPSSQSSLVGLKPTVGLLSRGGIVPISSTLDTPGPMTRNVTDNAILLDAMSGEDPKDVATKNNPKEKIYIETVTEGTLKGFRFGAFKNFMDNELYKASIEKIKAQGGEIIEFEPPKIELEKFLTLLNGDMFVDLPEYIKSYASAKVSVKNNADVMTFNLQDSTARSPYGQARFEGVVNENISKAELDVVRYFLHTEGKRYFNTPMDSLNLDAVLSINNYSAGFAAAAKYPALTIPMGYNKDGVPFGITFISRAFEEPKLLRWGYAFEQATKARKVPAGY